MGEFGQPAGGQVARGNRLGAIQQIVLPCRVGEGAAQHFGCLAERLGALDQPAVLARCTAEARDGPRIEIGLIGQHRISGVGRSLEEVGDLVIAKAINVVIVEPMPIGQLEELLREGF